MKVLVTGAGGFLGGAVLQSLRQHGHAVRAMVRPHTAAPPDEPGVEWVRADLRTSDLAAALEGASVVVHLAAQVAGSDEARFSSTVVGTERLLAAMADSGVGRLVLVSSYSVYDWSAASGVLDETSAVQARPYGRDGYTVAKVWQERLCREAAATQGYELVVLRPGFIWGPGHTDVSGAGVPIGGAVLVVGPRGRLPLTYVTNCAECVALAVEAPTATGRTFNVVDDSVVTAWRYAGIQQRALGSGVRVPVPYVLGRALVALASRFSRWIFRYGGKLPAVLVPASFDARFRPLQHTAEAAKRELGWRPRVSFDAAVTSAFDHQATELASRAEA